MTMGRAFADAMAAQIHEAVQGRAVVEQAKGVIAVMEEVDVATAYDRLLARTRTEGASLGEMARRVVDDAWSPRGPEGKPLSSG
jgi:AmiR/NasT family two-component response regulator